MGEESKACRYPSFLKDKVSSEVATGEIGAIEKKRRWRLRTGASHCHLKGKSSRLQSTSQQAG